MSDRAPCDCLLSSWMLRNIHEQKRCEEICIMSHISGIIAFQTKKLNLERDLHKDTDIK